MKKITLLLCFFYTIFTFGQIVNAPPFILTIQELKDWTEDGSTADASLIANIPLAERFQNTATQFNSNLTNDMEIAYLPDGMNNFGNYSGEQSQFNLYNFTNWAYIDKFVWFGGTASQTVQIPSAPWSNAAHKNGVKMFGDIFFSPNAFGGSTATLQQFLEQDGAGNFVVVPKLVAIMQYYKFDGWFINQETNTNAATAQLMYELLRDLTTAVEALGKEVMWYDAMLINGSVGWQNRLNNNNSIFVQNDEDNDTSNGFEQRVSSNIFINFFWNTTAFPSSSRTRANTIGRSSFEVFTGVDIWPNRNQASFQTGGNNWMTLLHENPVMPYTSLGLFAPNCVYNNSQYSNFNNDPTDYDRFFSAERHMFSGADRNPALEDASGFKGFANWIPATSTITQIPFETNFNTGNGLKKFTEGIETSNNPWHNMSDQDILPTWQFAFSQDDVLNARWDFENAYNGGSSLKVEGTIPANQENLLSLYKTKLPMTEDSKIDVFFNSNGNPDPHVNLTLTFADNPSQKINYLLSAPANATWFGTTISLADQMGRELATIGFTFLSSETENDYALNIGNIKVHEGPSLNIQENVFNENTLVIYYPSNQPELIKANINWTNDSPKSFEVFSLDGKRIIQKNITNTNFEINTSNLAKGLYILKVEGFQGFSMNRKIVVR